jgi:hypothetical protein
MNQGSTVLFTGSPIKASAYIESFDFNIAATPARLLLQLYSSVDDGVSPTPTLVLKRSLLLTYASGQDSGAKRVAVSWQVVAGDVFGFAVPAGEVSAIAFDVVGAGDALADSGANTWTTIWRGAPLTNVADKLTATEEGAGQQRVYRSARNTKRNRQKPTNEQVSDFLLLFLCCCLSVLLPTSLNLVPREPT